MCEECGQRPATVYVTKSVNGERSEARLCTQCALERGEIGPLMQSPGWLLDQFLSVLGGLGTGVAAESAAPARVGRRARPSAPATERCPRCGLEYAQFARTGLLGCSECYDAFRAPLGPALRRIHGAATHVGVRPARHAPGAPETAAGGRPATARQGRGDGTAEAARAARAGGAPSTAAGSPSGADAPDEAAKQARIAALRDQLRAAVADERFEDAARLRDEIRRLEG